MDRSGLLAWLSSEEMRSMGSDQRNLLEALETKAAQIERDSLTGLLELDQQTQGLLGQLEQADLHLAALETQLGTQLTNLRSLRSATAALEDRSAQIQLAQTNRLKLAQVIEQYLKQ